MPTFTAHTAIEDKPARELYTVSDPRFWEQEAEPIENHGPAHESPDQPVIIEKLQKRPSKLTRRPARQQPAQKPDPARRLFFYPDYHPGDLVYIDGLPYTAEQAARHYERTAQQVVTSG